MERLTHKQAIKKHIAECKCRMETIDEFMKHPDADIEGGDKNIFILKTVVSELEQVQELKERDTAKKPIKTKGLKNFHGNIYKVVGECSNCGCGVNSFMMFCDYCGQRLKWEA